jgi:RNA polymerase sigma-54 factor
MSLSQSMSMRTEMRQLLTPRMIQSMEILQMPLAALEERIEQELASNPVLELKEPGELDRDGPDLDLPRERNEALVVDSESASGKEFDRLARIGEYLENEEWSPSYAGSGSGNYVQTGDRDAKMDAMANTAARGGNLTEDLMQQLRLLDLDVETTRAGKWIIENLAPDGYLRTELEVLAAEARPPLTVQVLARALVEVQSLEPAGIAARSLQECFLLQLDVLEEDEERPEGHDFPLERLLISRHMEDLKLNRYPQLSKKLDRPIEELKAAVKRLSHLHPYPGKLAAGDAAPQIVPDANITKDEETGKWVIEMTHDPASTISISQMYRKLVKDKSADRKTREFLAGNVRSAQWLLESIQQRRNTLQRVIRQVVDAQEEFFEHGPEHLKPLPMIDVAERLGIHVATVSRAVAEKYIQTPLGVFPLRRFFSGGTQTDDGTDMSWDAVKEKLKVIIAEEDKSDPLDDETIVNKLKEQGIVLARRTVAKYRGILGIPTARQRREF